MSIDHGNVLAVVEEMTAPLVSYKFTPSQQAHITSWANKLRALAQPAEAVEGDIREFLGKVVRQTWIEWAREQPNPKPSWLVPWEGLSEPDREVDRRIGERIASLSSIRHDAAQGAVADVSLTARKLLADQFPHQITKDLLVIDGRTDGVVDTTLALAAIEDALRTHPQAAPALESPSLKQIVPDKERGPEPDPDTGADRGSCCEHAYADGWNDCVGEVEKRVTVAAQAAPAQGDGWKLVPVIATVAMSGEGASAMNNAAASGMNAGEALRSVWSAMLAATPSPEPRERKWYDEGEPVDESKVSNQAQEPRS